MAELAYTSPIEDLSVDGLVRCVFDLDGLTEEIVYDQYPVAQNGTVFDLSKDFILLDECRERISFSRLNPLLLNHVKAYIADSLPRLAQQTISSRFSLFCTVFKDLNAEPDLTESIKNVYITIMKPGGKFNNRPTDKSSLREFYRYCSDEELPFFDEDFLDYYLEQLTFGSDPNKGRDVLTPMKNRGCLTFKENREWQKAIKALDLNSLSQIELHGFIGLRIAQVTGARSIQVRNLRVGHFGRNAAGYYLDIPRAKQRGKSKRKALKRRLITTSLGREIEFHIEKMRMEDSEPVDSKTPLIPTLSKRGRTSTLTRLATSCDSYNRRTKLCVARLGLDFVVTNRRLRKTFCTALISQGTALKVVAELMDHQDLQQLQVYYRQTKEIARKLGQIFAQEYSDVLDAFQGKLIEKGEQSQDGQLLFAENRDMELCDIGSCGSDKLCMKSPPLSCYSCSSAELFEDADHKSVMERFISNSKATFGEQHASAFLESEEFIAMQQVVNMLEDQDE